MNFRSLLLTLTISAIAALAFFNWSTLATPTQVSLGLITVEAPLGLLMLSLTTLLAALFIAYVLWLQGSVLLETRRHGKEMQAQRELADKAEASRFTELRAHLDREVSRLAEVIGNQTRETLSRVDRAEMGLRERPVDAEISRLVQAVETHNRELHARVDRLEIGLRERLSAQLPGPAPQVAVLSRAAPPAGAEAGSGTSASG